MIQLPIIQAVYCPLSKQLHSIALCEQLCDNYLDRCLSNKVVFQTVLCPAINRLMDVGCCADTCDHYEGNGKETDYMPCSYETKSNNEINHD